MVFIQMVPLSVIFDHDVESERDMVSLSGMVEEAMHL